MNPEEMPDEHEGDEDELLNHVALEAMHAIDAKDHEAFMPAMHVLISHTVNKLRQEDGNEE